MCKQQEQNTLIEQTQNWLNAFIIHYNICPFAERVANNQSIKYKVITNSTIENCLVQLIDQLIKLNSNDEVETALLIFPNVVQDFDDFLDFLAIANQLIEDQGFSDDFQLASFHPDYCFEGEEAGDPANFTNKAPFPMLHIIRQSSIEKALQFYENPQQIPEQNIKLTRKLGAEFLSKLRKDCMRLQE